MKIAESVDMLVRKKEYSTKLINPNKKSLFSHVKNAEKLFVRLICVTFFFLKDYYLINSFVTGKHTILYFEFYSQWRHKFVSNSEAKYKKMFHRC